MKTFTVKDLNDKYVTIDCDVLAKQLSEVGFQVLGMDFDCIAELRAIYMLKGGKLPFALSW